MSNFPSIIFPAPLKANNAFMILHDDSVLTIKKTGEVILEGNVKSAALGLVKHVVEHEHYKGVREIWINNTLLINCEGTVSISYTGDKKPEFWEELSNEFDRIIKMKAFW